MSGYPHFRGLKWKGPHCTILGGILNWRFFFGGGGGGGEGGILATNLRESIITISSITAGTVYSRY